MVVLPEDTCMEEDTQTTLLRPPSPSGTTMEKPDRTNGPLAKTMAVKELSLPVDAPDGIRVMAAAVLQRHGSESPGTGPSPWNASVLPLGNKGFPPYTRAI